MTRARDTLLSPLRREPDEPIPAELFGIEQHAESLAAAEGIRERPGRGPSLLPRVRENGRVLLAGYHDVVAAVGAKREITLAHEWFLDNFRVVDEQLREIRAAGHLAGAPRVYGLAWAYVAHTDSRFELETLGRFVRAHLVRRRARALGRGRARLGSGSERCPPAVPRGLLDKFCLSSTLSATGLDRPGNQTGLPGGSRRDQTRVAAVQIAQQSPTRAASCAPSFGALGGREREEGIMEHDRDFGDLSKFVDEASQLRSCFWCGTPHPAVHPLSVCPACAQAYRVKRFPMGPLEMSGPFRLDDEVIDQVVSQTSPGNYALGYLDGDTFRVFYVGRSDSDVRSRLHEWVGTPSGYARYASSAKAAWGTRQRGCLPVDAPAQGRVGARGESSYTRFAYSYASSKELAFEKECRNYDDFGGSVALDNTARPISSP